MDRKAVGKYLPPSSDGANFVSHSNRSKKRWKHTLLEIAAFSLLFIFYHLNLSQSWHSSPELPVHAIHEIYPDSDLPLRPATEPWDISTSYPYPRQLSKNVTEGTWLRITTHPKKDEIVFDMLGDLYCMKITSPKSDSITAIPFLQGVPYEKDASFSPDGRHLVFISDAGFGVDNIWTIPYTDCDKMSQMSQEQVRASALQQTNSTFRFFTSPVFHPKEPKLLATKWFLTGRPNGAGEIWEFPLLSESQSNLPELGGERIISRKLPAIWPKEKYFESQLGVEQPQYAGLEGDGIVYTRNIRDDAGGKFSYGKDVHKGINAIFLYNRTTDTVEQLVDAFPGGANVPRLSRDGKTLAYVKRLREKEVLVLKDLTSGTVHHAWDGLSYDVSIIPAFMGAYPNYGFTADDTDIVIWSQGHIWRVPLIFNNLHERVAASNPIMLPFEASINVALGPTRYSETDVRQVELKDEGRVHVLRGVRSDEHGENVIFEAAGDTHILDVSTQRTTLVPKRSHNDSYYHPSFVNSNPSRVLHAKWNDHSLTTFEIVDVASGNTAVVDVPRGRYLSPVINHGHIAFIRTGADMMLGGTEETAGEGIWLGDIDTAPICSSNFGGYFENDNVKLPVTNLRRIDRRASQDIRLEFTTLSGKTYLLVQAGDSVSMYRTDKLKLDVRTNLVKGKTSTEMAVARPIESHNQKSFEIVAFRDFQNVWLGSIDNHQEGTPTIWSKPHDVYTPSSLVRLSPQGGHDVVFSGDGKMVFWAFGPHIYFLPVEEIFASCVSAKLAERDSGSCAHALTRSIEINATYVTDLARMKWESNDTAVVIANATLITMENPHSSNLVANGTIILKDGVIVDVGEGYSVTVPERAYTINAEGGAVVPGYVDAHGHWASFLTPYPFASWEHETFLGYGVTTLHNPSSRTLAGPWERALVEKGHHYAPRLYNVGEVLYGSTQPSVYTEINTMEDARAALLRQQIEGGESSFSVKNYQLSRRSARQRLLLEAEKMNMLIVPEGGFGFDWGLTYFIDGMTTHEHPLPIPELYDDVLSLIAASGTSYTQVAAMNYGGLFGQGWVHQTFDIVGDPKLNQYIKHDVMEKLTEVIQAPNYDYQVFNTTISVKKLKDRGVRTNIGAHGEQPIGFLYHQEMQLHAMGGQTPYEVLRASTIEGAISLGLQSSIGSLSVGKLADLVIYPLGVDTVEKVFEKSWDMEFVMRGNRLFSVRDGLMEVWPRAGRRQDRPRFDPETEI